MFSRKSKYCVKCDKRVICFTQYPMLVGDRSPDAEEKTKNETDQEHFNWRSYSSPPAMHDSDFLWTKRRHD